MPTKKSVSFANQHGKPLVHVKKINKEGRSIPVTKSEGASKPIKMDQKYIKSRRKTTEKMLEVQLFGLEEKLKRAEKAHKDVKKLMNSYPNMSSKKLTLQDKNKMMRSVIGKLKIDINIMKNRLKAQKKIG